MSRFTKVVTPKQAKKTLRSIMQGTLIGPPDQIESLRQTCLRIITDQRADVISFKTPGADDEP